MPCAPRGTHTRRDVYGILSGEWRCLCAARLRVATVVPRARGSRVENVSARGRPTRHQRRPRAFEPAPAAWPPAAACAGGRWTSPGGDPPDPPAPLVVTGPLLRGSFMSRRPLAGTAPLGGGLLWSPAGGWHTA